MLQYRYVMDKLIDVPPESFNPPPKVNSAIVRMIPFAPHELPEVDETVLSDVVKAAFAQRRKVLRNNLGAYRDTIDFDALGFDLTRRAEEVPVAEFVTLAQTVQRSKA
jgi:16S rRNA (adenine1518-N6/adenine1519-N6)-dimethyltransferase